ncbi:hypothetical protein NDU88_007227 [Pleurodeles waltl]|uniref:Myb/SANT-like DNA-binding domain-containing protein n=1 Tax=Pleurodeles waltl TaxID=8319 RepID=A0AAV7N4R9_PLEWA|nr:hypothetical protein NDU88_007227 [Pleurodeles waltl]
MQHATIIWQTFLGELHRDPPVRWMHLNLAFPRPKVSAHQKKGIWRAIAKDVQTLGVYSRQSTHCRKRWEDLRRWAQKMAEAQLEMASKRGRGACRILTPLMARILGVAYPELDGRLTASQQLQEGEYSAHHYNLRMVWWYPGRGCVSVVPLGQA